MTRPHYADHDDLHSKAGVFVDIALWLIAAAMAFWAWCADAFWFELHASSFRCIRNPHTLSAGNFFRWTALAASLGMFFWLRPRCVRWVKKKGISSGSVARNAAAIALALVVAEMVLRKPWRNDRQPENGKPLCPAIVPSPRDGYDLVPSTSCSETVDGRDIPYAINGEGNRYDGSATQSNHERSTILIGGESIALGVGVPYRATFGAVLEDRLGDQTVNTGVYGYSLGQVYLREAATAAVYAHVVALVTIFISEEATRSENEDLPRLRLGKSGELGLVAPTPQWIREVQLRRVFQSLYHGSAELDDMRATARAIADLAREHGAFALFVTTNFVERCRDVKGRAPSLFRQVFDEQHLSRVHVDLPATDLLQNNGHPNAAGHLRIADAVEAALRDAGVGKSAR